jgi:uncharacterized protein YjbI with pentapeptide repeats
LKLDFTMTDLINGAPPKKTSKRIISAVGALCILAGITYFFWIRPNQQLNDSKSHLSSKEFLELKTNIRTGWAQAMGGAVLLIGLFFTWRNIRATEKNVEIAQENIRVNQDSAAKNLAITQRNLEITQENIRNTQENAARNLAIAQEGQITERFTRAVEQLGNKESMASRLGGIYALERIAQDSERDHWPIVEILCAFVRENAAWKGGDAAVPENVEDMLVSIKEPEPDIRSILKVLGRRTLANETDNQKLDLLRTDLRRHVLEGAHLEKANISHSRMDWSTLRDTHLDGAFLFNSHLEKVFALKASFKGAQLGEAHLERAWLQYADFEGADLSRTHFEKAYLHGTNFRAAELAGSHWEGAFLLDADLRGVNLSKVNGLTQQQIESARMDDRTQLPGTLKRSVKPDEGEHELNNNS